MIQSAALVAAGPGKPAAFLDRDGTLIDDVGFVHDPGDVQMLPTVVEALRTLADAGYACVVVTNQSGVARGYFDEAAVRGINAEINAQLSTAGVRIDGYYFCPHYDTACVCRKPEPGLIHSAAGELGLDVRRSAVVGDRGSDIELGQRLGIPGVLVPGPHAYAGPEPDFRARTLLEAAQWIVRRGLNLIEVPTAGELLARMAGRRVVVVGDVMIDEWIWGNVSRISARSSGPRRHRQQSLIHPWRRRQRRA